MEYIFGSFKGGIHSVNLMWLFWLLVTQNYAPVTKKEKTSWEWIMGTAISLVSYLDVSK